MNLKTKLLKLHLGCGSYTPEGWINIDGSWNALFSKWPTLRYLLRKMKIIPKKIAETEWHPDVLVHDVRKPLPFPNNSVNYIYASHLLEHLYLIEAKNLLRECHRVLVNGGVVRMVVPDLKKITSDYLNGKKGIDNHSKENLPLADILNQKLLLRSAEPPSGTVLYRIYTNLKDFHSHKWMYDVESLVFHFKDAGLINVRQCNYLESVIPGIECVEKAGRVLDGAGICVEGEK